MFVADRSHTLGAKPTHWHSLTSTNSDQFRSFSAENRTSTIPVDWNFVLRFSRMKRAVSSTE